MSLKDIEEQLYGMKSDDSDDVEKEIFEEPKVEPERTRWKDPEPPKVKNKTPEYRVPKKTPVNFYETKKKPIVLYAVLGVLALILIVQGIFVAVRYFSRDANIKISFSTQDNILVAAPFELNIEYKNNSSNLLKNAVLTLELPEDVESVDDSGDGFFITRSLGDLGTGSSNNQLFNLVAAGGTNRVVEFEATLQYDLPGFSSRFEKAETKEVEIGGTALDLNLVLPTNIISGEEFTLELNYANNTGKTLTGLEVQAFYPLGFDFIDAINAPSEGNDFWSLGDLGPNENGKILITGTIIGQTDSYYSFSAQLSLLVNKNLVSLDKMTSGVSIQASPLKLALSLNDASDYIVSLGETLNYKVEYQNNTEVDLKEVILKVKLNSDLFDLNSVQSSGYHDSLNGQIVWNAGNNEDLRLIQKGESGSVSFSVQTKNNYSIKKMSDKNFFVKVSAQMESPSVPSGTDWEKTTATTELSNKVSGKTQLISFAMFRDADSGIVNKGTLPLVVGNATNFTIHWKFINYSNDISNLTVKTVLPQGVSWSNVVGGNYGESAPVYNERTGEVIWQISNLPATTGIVLPAREAIFQISVVPSTNQVGSYMTLIGPMEISGVDDFTGQQIDFTNGEINSSLENDSSVNDEDGKVRL